jgi:hypothetical protein
MRMNRVISAFLLVAPSVIAIGLKDHQTPPRNTSTIFSTHRRDGDGNLWLRWDQSERKTYLSGYLDGYHSGHDEGCGTAIDILAPTPSQLRLKDPSRNCNNAEAHWLNPDQSYADQITDFYSRFPDERDVPLPFMLWAMSGGNEWSAQKIHEWHLARLKEAETRPSAPNNK